MGSEKGMGCLGVDVRGRKRKQADYLATVHRHWPGPRKKKRRFWPGPTQEKKLALAGTAAHEEENVIGRNGRVRIKFIKL